MLKLDRGGEGIMREDRVKKKKKSVFKIIINYK